MVEGLGIDERVRMREESALFLGSESEKREESVVQRIEEEKRRRERG